LEEGKEPLSRGDSLLEDSASGLLLDQAHSDAKQTP